jgi:hypothetical protein
MSTSTTRHGQHSARRAVPARVDSDSPARELGRAVHGVGEPDGTPIPAGAYISGDETIGRLACD